MASMTGCGFCEVAALSRYTSGLPWIRCLRTGKSSRICSTSKGVVTGLVRVLMEFLEENAFQRICQRFHLDAVDNVLGEGVDQEVPRVDFRDAARLKVKQHLAIELADGSAVGAADVVRPDLQLRLGIDSRIVAEDQIFVGLLGIGLLG